MRFWGLPLAFGLLGCAHSGTQIQREEGVVYSNYRHIGVPPLKDPRGQGRLIADDISKGLQRLMYDDVDARALEQVLTKYKPDRELGLGLEALQNIREKTSADAILLGRMAPDWSAALITLVETNLGDPILHLVVRPKGRNKAFASPEEIATETVRVISSLR